jgi:hypothetical protein
MKQAASIPKPRQIAPDSLAFCQAEIARMLRNSQTKVIAPIITLGLLKSYHTQNKIEFTDSEIQYCYDATVQELKAFLGHDVHIGAKYYDAYGSRMSRYKLLASIGHLKYRLLPPYTTHAVALYDWIPSRIAEHITNKLGVVPKLADIGLRIQIAESAAGFLELVTEQIDKSPANFEIFSFAVLKAHLQRFACRIYRDTRTAAHDHGVDLSTNFGVVYQIKKLRVLTESDAAKICAELQQNFDDGRLKDGNVVLVIDDISKDVKQYLINLKIQSISKVDVLQLARGLEDPEDRQRVLRVVYEEFRREYGSVEAGERTKRVKR